MKDVLGTVERVVQIAADTYVTSCYMDLVEVLSGFVVLEIVLLGIVYTVCKACKDETNL